MLDRREKTMLINMLKDPDRKNLLQIVFEFSKCSMAKGELAGHYFTRLLYKKEFENYLDYITNREMQAIRYRDKDDYEESLGDILDNKILFYLYFRQFDIRLPATLGWNSGGQVTIGKTLYETERQANLGTFLGEAMRQHNLEKIFVKPAEGSCGYGCAFLSLKQVEGGIGCYPGLLEGSFLFQEPVLQHQAISAVYPYSLNTLRLDTFIDSSGKANLITSYIRFGVKNSSIDNSRMGGCFIAVDLATGELKDKAYNLLENGGRSFSRHPSTQVLFKGVKIPWFEEAKEMALEAARLLPYRLTGWDIGIAADGPVLMEGNSAYHLNGSDMAFGGFRKHPVYQEILKEFVDERPQRRTTGIGTNPRSGARVAAQPEASPTIKQGRRRRG